jgi:hypothetical protein
MCGALSPEVTVFAPSPWFPAGITARSCCSFNFLAIRGKDSVLGSRLAARGSATTGKTLSIHDVDHAPSAEKIRCMSTHRWTLWSARGKGNS